METPPPIKPKRPTFLLVLCILTFVFSGFNALASLFGLAFSSTFYSEEANEQSLETIYDAAEDAPGGMGDFLMDVAQMSEQAMQNQEIINLSNLLLYLLCVFGAILMYRLKKVGFHVYTAASAFLLIVPFLFMGLNWIVILSVIFNGLFTIGFVVMYGLNLKHMNN